MPGPVPKQPGQRRRRNRQPAGTKLLPAGGRVGPTPPLGKRPGGGSWLKSTREWWRVLWASPMATEYQDADAWTLRRVAFMYDLAGRGELNAALTRELRLLLDAFGLTAYGRRRLGWWIAEGEVVELRSAPSPRRLRATDSDGAP